MDATASATRTKPRTAHILPRRPDFLAASSNSPCPVQVWLERICTASDVIVDTPIGQTPARADTSGLDTITLTRLAPDAAQRRPTGAGWPGCSSTTSLRSSAGRGRWSHVDAAHQAPQQRALPLQSPSAVRHRHRRALLAVGDPGRRARARAAQSAPRRWRSRSHRSAGSRRSTSDARWCRRGRRQLLAGGLDALLVRARARASAWAT